MIFVAPKKNGLASNLLNL